MNTDVQILLVEDDDIAAETVLRAFKKAKIANPIVRACDGIEALDILRGKNGQPKLPQPHLILLDLKMPRMDGLKFLDEIRGDKELTKSIVFVLTTSADEKDRLKAYNNHVAGYILKSNAGSNFLELLNLLNCYWRIIEFPPAKLA